MPDPLLGLLSLMLAEAGSVQLVLSGPLGGQAAEKVLEWLQDKVLSWLHGSSGIDWPKKLSILY